MKYEYKFFYDWDRPSLFNYFRHWFFYTWKLSGQVGFRICGVYVNLMWRKKVSR